MMRRIATQVLCACLLAIPAGMTWAAPASAVTPGPATAFEPTVQVPAGKFVTLAFHDIRSDTLPAVDHDPYAMSHERLAALFDWFQRHDWHPISLGDIDAARSGRRSLPPNAVLLSFDDGLESFYRQAYPLLQAFDYPALFSLQTGWLERIARGETINPNDGTALTAHIDDAAVITGRDKTTEAVRESDAERGADGFVSWDEVRDMQASGLVEIASHSHDLHHGILANPQGNLEPAALARRYDAGRDSYETETEYRRRLREDLSRSADVIEAQTGQRPRVLVWPYGATNAMTESIARQAGYRYTFSLGDQRISSPASGSTFGRFLAMDNPDPVTIEAGIARTLNPPERIQRAVQVDLDYLYDADPAQVNANLSALLDRIKAMQVRTVYLQAFADPDGDGTASSLYFPNDHLPMRADLFNRVAWQLKTRAGVEVYAWLPLLAFDLPDAERQRQLMVHTTDASGNRRVAERDYRRLSPFRPEAQQIVRGIYADLARNTPAINGVLIHDDAYLAADEDAQACAPQARWPGTGQRIEDCELSPRDRTQALIDFSEQAVGGARSYANQSNAFRVARNLYARVVLDPSAEARFAQALGPFLEHYDEVALMAMPYLDGTGENPERWLDRLVDSVMRHPEGLSRTVFELQAYNWEQHRWIDPERLRGWMHQLTRRGARNLAYYPDDFIAGKPDFQPTFEGMSLNEFPYWRSRP